MTPTQAPVVASMNFDGQRMTIDLDDGKFHHLAIANRHIYIDGMQIGTVDPEITVTIFNRWFGPSNEETT